MEVPAHTDVTPAIEAAEARAKGGDVEGAVEELLAVERAQRRAEDEGAVRTLLVAIPRVCWEANDVEQLCSTVVLLAKRRGQFPQAVVGMVEVVMGYMDDAGLASESADKLLETLLLVCEGKIFLEIPRARLTQRRARQKEAAGDVKGAAEELHDIQVETLGSMDKDEKLAFILEQMRLCLAAGDWLRVLIISRKIHRKVFANGAFQKEKIQYHELLIAYHLHEGNYLHVARSLLAIYNTPCVLDDDAEWRPVIAKAAVFIVLSKHAPDQQDLLHRVKKEKNLAALDAIYDLVSLFTTSEIMDWPHVQATYGPELAALGSGYFDGSEDGAKRMLDLRSRVIEHNLRVVAAYYSRISLDRLATLLSLDAVEAEKHLCAMVTDAAIVAKIDRLAGVVSFVRPLTPDEVLNNWASDVSALIAIVEKCNHSVSKELVMHGIE